MDTNRSKTIGANIRAELSRAGVTQAALAAELGLPQSAVSKRLRGATPFLAVEVAAIADVLGVPVAALYADRARERVAP